MQLDIEGFRQLKYLGTSERNQILKKSKTSKTGNLRITQQGHVQVTIVALEIE